MINSCKVIVDGPNVDLNTKCSHFCKVFLAHNQANILELVNLFDKTNLVINVIASHISFSRVTLHFGSTHVGFHIQI